MTNARPKFPAVPNLNLIRECSDGIRIIIDLLDWCENGQEAGFDHPAYQTRAFLARDDSYSPHGPVEIMESHERVAWRFYGIDHRAVEEERGAVLDYQRQLNAYHEREKKLAGEEGGAS